ncbi:Inner membrane protein YedI [BD1-7 clade bacterium]|uniref:Inner membrane protein YedI n=1 Tax=BD1-7 clade bacterium TaxID=2029982 RepID=A0A5S9PPL0_9GAMM|nr:Inner membrane protein YedI [BD1-7 clade bacterium]
MAASSLLALIDDIATVLDDVAVLSKVAAKKTAGVLGDDLALNAEQVSGVRANRELPVVWAVAKGSFINKLILVPAALLISTLLPAAVTWLLMLGGAFLCFEGFEKVWHKLFHKQEVDADNQALHDALKNPDCDLMALEKQKIKGAIRTDFVLSAEIIVICLGTVSAAPFVTQLTVLSALAIAFTVGVYGLVAGIVKIDDLGFWLARQPENSTLAGVKHAVGNGLIAMAPWLMRALSVLGTIAMFMVGGGILLHGIPGAEAFIHQLSHNAIVNTILPTLAGMLLGIVAGGVITAAVSPFQKKAHA